MNEETKQKVQQVLDRAIENKELAGASILVRKDGEEVFYLERGVADVEKKTPLRRDHIFRLYSMSKPITGAAAMKLFEDGLIDLAEPVSTYIPAFQNLQVEENGQLVPAKRDLMVKDLLDMTSGLLYNEDSCLAGKHSIKVFDELDERLFTDHPMTTMEFASKMAEGPLAFQPGSKWQYGTSADILGAVIEAASGMRFGEYLKKNFFEPLGMNDTGFYVPEEKRDRLVCTSRIDESGKLVPYVQNHLGIINAMDREPAFESGGAGLVSTIDDYARFAQMLLNGGELDGKRILKAETIRFMTAGSLTPDLQKWFEVNFSNMLGFSYGNLYRVMKNTGRSVSLNHEGEYGWDGWLGCYFANDPAANMTILVMMQRTDAGMTPVVRKMRNVIMSERT